MSSKMLQKQNHRKNVKSTVKGFKGLKDAKESSVYFR